MERHALFWIGLLKLLSLMIPTNQMNFRTKTIHRRRLGDNRQVLAATTCLLHFLRRASIPCVTVLSATAKLRESSQTRREVAVKARGPKNSTMCRESGSDIFANILLALPAALCVLARIWWRYHHCQASIVNPPYHTDSFACFLKYNNNIEIHTALPLYKNVFTLSLGIAPTTVSSSWRPSWPMWRAFIVGASLSLHIISMDSHADFQAGVKQEHATGHAAHLDALEESVNCQIDADVRTLMDNMREIILLGRVCMGTPLILPDWQ